ncbi:MAG: hypothetical protein ACLPKT_16270 [Methylocella sp.]
MKTILAELASEPWARAVLNDVRQKGGLVGKNMANFFELRFGHALHEAGFGVEYEVPGEGASTLDFGFTSKGQSWKVEMMRLQETKAAKAATKTGVDEHGGRWARQILSSDNKDKKQSPEGETLKAVQRICQKCESGGKPHKFPKPDKALHVILVDLRTFKNGGDVHDRMHIGLGGEYVNTPEISFLFSPSPQYIRKGSFMDRGQRLMARPRRASGFILLGSYASGASNPVNWRRLLNSSRTRISSKMQPRSKWQSTPGRYSPRKC